MPFCPKCGIEAPSDAVYCPSCGLKLITTSPSSPIGEGKPTHRVIEFSWGKSFSYAIRYILYAILWIVIGGLIMGFGIGTIAASVRIGAWGIPRFLAGAVIGLIATIVGLIIMYLGMMAAYFKIMSRLIYEAVYKYSS
jgi:hypothetical protein